MELSGHNAKLNIFWVIPLLVSIFIIIYMALQMSYLRQQLVSQESQLLALRNSKDMLGRQLQETNSKLATLISANDFLEKNAERLDTIRDFLEGQLNKANEQLAKQLEIMSNQQEIMVPLEETNSKLDRLISQVEYLYLQSAKAPTLGARGNKGKVNVFLTPAEEK